MTQNHIYPSQEKYYGKNPVVSFRLKEEDKKKLEEMASREDMTVGQYVRNYLKGIVEKRETEAKIYKDGRKDGFDDGRNEGLEEGYEKGKKDWQIWFDCYKCDEPCYIEPGDVVARKEISKTFIGWAHKSCTEKKGTRNLHLPEGFYEILLARVENQFETGRKE